MMKIPDPRRGLVRCSVRALGLAAAAMLVLSAAPEPARGSAVTDQSGRGAHGKNGLRRSDH